MKRATIIILAAAALAIPVSGGSAATAQASKSCVHFTYGGWVVTARANSYTSCGFARRVTIKWLNVTGRAMRGGSKPARVSFWAHSSATGTTYHVRCRNRYYLQGSGEVTGNCRANTSRIFIDFYSA